MKKIMFIDTVTTGMSPDKCAIHRLGGIYTENGTERMRFELRMRPFANARIAEQSLWICGENRSSILHYQEQSEVFKQFVDILNGLVELQNPHDKIYLAGFNCAAFDVPFIREWFRMNGNERFRDYFHVQSIDTMCLATVALLDERRSMPDFHLETAAKHLGVDVAIKDKYDSLTNVKASLDIYRTFMERAGLAPHGNEEETDELITNF